jgi:uncharacterized protein with PIN domain
VPPTRFVTDDSLAFVARRLRLLGYDVAMLRGGRLDDVFASANDEQRTVLTLSERRPSRFAAVPALTLRRGHAAESVRAIAHAHEPSGPPFGRCPMCNTPLQRRLAFEARGEVPGGVLRGAETLSYCPGCARWYWEGSHTARLRSWLEAALGRPIDDPRSPNRA